MNKHYYINRREQIFISSQPWKSYKMLCLNAFDKVQLSCSGPTTQHDYRPKCLCIPPDSTILVHQLIKENVRVSVRRIDKNVGDSVDAVRITDKRTAAVGVLLDGHCHNTQPLLHQVTLF